MPRGGLLILGIVLAIACEAMAGDDLPAGLAGLLSPAQVPDGPPDCLRASTKARWPVLAEAGPDSKILGELHFRPWGNETQACEAVEAWFTAVDATEPRLVPLRESGYEVPALMVLEQRGTWHRIVLGNDAGWVQPPGDATYEPYPALLRDKLAFATTAWDSQLCQGPSKDCTVTGSGAEASLNVLAERRHSGETWIEVELVPDPCSGGASTPLARGWMRARDARGQANAWFHSRGC